MRPRAHRRPRRQRTRRSADAPHESPGLSHPQDAAAYLNSDIYRLTTNVSGTNWKAYLKNAFATANPELTREMMLEVVPTLDPEVAKVVLLNNFPASFADASLEPLAKAAVKFGHLKAEPDYDSLVWGGP